MSEKIPSAEMPKQRFVGVDIVKIIGTIFICGVHFFLYSGFYQEPINEPSEVVPIFLRWLFYNCVPMFMITTGYLMKNKILSKEYYFGLVKIVVIYIIMSIACAVFDYQHFDKEFTPWSFIRGMFMFTNAPYSWYVEYYICIFLLIPFINLAFNGLKTRKQRLFLVVISLVLTTAARSVFIGYDPETQIQVIPDFFSSAYPVAYYLAGAYIREYPPARTLNNKFTCILGLLFVLGWNTVMTYYHSVRNTENNNAFASWHYNDYGTWPVFLASLCIFLLLFDITAKNRFLCRILKTLSDATLGCFLVSYIFDNSWYLDFVYAYPDMKERCSHGYQIVGKVYLYSIICGMVVHGIYNLCHKGISKLYRDYKQNAPVTTENKKAE